MRLTQSTPLNPWLPTAVAATAAAAGLTATVSPLAALGFLGASAAALVLLNPASALPLLIVAATVNRFAIPWGSASIRVEIIVALLLLTVLLNQLLVRSIPLSALKSPVLLPFCLYGVVNLLSTVLFAADRPRGLKLDAEIFAAIAVFVVLTALLSRPGGLSAAIRTLWVVTVAEAAIGLIALLAFAVHISTLGVQLGDYGLPMVYGTQWEANIFGSFLLGNFFILLADYVAGRRTPWRVAGLLIVVAGIAASMTRTVWLALLLGVIVFALTAARARGSGGLVLPILAAAPILALVGLVIGSATPFASRLLDLVNLQSSSAHGRLLMFDAALSEWRHNPILGLGTGSFNFGAQPGLPHPWLANLLLLTLHDTGLIGLAILAWLLFAFYRTTFQGLRPDSHTGVVVAGSVAAFTSLLIAFQATTGFWFAYPWVVTAIGLAAARRTPIEPPESA